MEGTSSCSFTPTPIQFRKRRAEDQNSPFHIYKQLLKLHNCAEFPSDSSTLSFAKQFGGGVGGV